MSALDALPLLLCCYRAGLGDGVDEELRDAGVGGAHADLESAASATLIGRDLMGGERWEPRNPSGTPASSSLSPLSRTCMRARTGTSPRKRPAR